MWVLSIRSPNDVPREHVLKNGRTTIGRKSENDIPIVDEAASRLHAEIVFDAEAGTLTLTDLGSTNGTFLNQDRVVEPTRLQVNDQIRIGQYTIDLDKRETRSLANTLLDTQLLNRNLLLESLDRYAVLLCDVSERLNTLIDPDMALSEVADLIRDAMGADKSKLILAESFSRLQEMGFPTTIAQKAISQRAAVIIPDMYLSTQTDPTVGKSGLLMHIHTALCVPVMMGEEVLGLLYVYKTGTTSRPFGPRDLQLAVAICHQAALTIQRTRLLDGLLQLSSALRQASTRADMLPIILDKALALVAVEGCVLVLRDQASDTSTVELGRGALAQLAGERQLLDEPLIQQALASGKVEVNDEMSTNRRLLRPSLFSGLTAVASVPLVAQDYTLGVLIVGRKTELQDSELRLLRAIADIAASALHASVLRDQTEQRLHRLIALRTIDQSIAANRDLSVTLAALLNQSRAQLGVDAVSILLFDAPTQTLVYAAKLGFQTAALQHTRLKLGEGLAGRAAQLRQVVHVGDLTAAPDGLARAPLLGTEKFVTYYGVPLVAGDQVKGVLEVFHHTPLSASQEWVGFLEAVAGQAAIAIDNATLFDKLQRSNLELALAYDTTLEGWSRALDLRDRETEGHTQRVTELTLRLAAALNVGAAEQLQIRRGALLHDIGKMGIPDSILLKPGPLTDEERKVMHLHPTYALELLTPITYLRPALDIPFCHHEKWDGSGYPRGLKGEAIPLPARLFALVDVWDALNSDRPYHKAWSRADALAYVREQPGKHFDPKVVELFLRVVIEPEGG
jgi:HD-GYP domain-containing protein (c-di-GMP phosphodiesterase class II)/pSer/pThr/pTyr-binding forkhead associated (FHA) protein